MRSRVRIGLALTALLACSSEKRAADSSVREPGATATGNFSIDAAPSLTIPGTAPNDQTLIGHAVGATQLSGGSVLIADGYDLSIRTFNSSGRLVRSAGRRGGGPGEYQSLFWFRQCGHDTVFAWDPAQSRMSVVDSSGRFSREARLPVSPGIITCSRSGMIATLMAQEMTTGPGERSPRLISRLVVVDARGDSLWSLPNIPVGQWRPLATITRIALGDDRLYVGTGDSAYVDAYDLRGQRVATFRVGGTLRAPTTKNYERAIDISLATLPGTPKGKEIIRQKMLAIPMPEHLPSYTDLFVDPAGSLWVVTSVPGDGRIVLRAFAPSGQSLGEIHLPIEMRIFEVGSDHLLGAYEAPDGQEHVALYHLRRNR
jgi:outer membrane protein assembly factor BamB